MSDRNTPIGAEMLLSFTPRGSGGQVGNAIFENAMFLLLEWS